MNYSFHPHAEKELEEAEKYYDNIREELGNRFRAETEMAISRILDFPNASLSLMNSNLFLYPSKALKRWLGSKR